MKAHLIRQEDLDKYRYEDDHGGYRAVGFASRGPQLRAPAGFAAIAIGLALTLIHLISIPVTNTSVNPARSTGVALFVGDWAIGQLWLFWVAPIVGALLGAAIYHFVASEEAEHVQPSVAPAVLGTAAIVK
ncbi:MAG TPA: aquaporin [Candidatus Binatia bacterium]